MPNQSMSRVDQAALILLGLGEEAAAKVLSYFEQAEIEQIVKAMSTMTGIKTSLAQRVIDQFFEHYQLHSGIKGASKAYVTNTLNRALGDDMAKNIIDQIYGDEIKIMMQRLHWVEPKRMATFLSNEHPQMQAIFLSFLPSELSAEVLHVLDDELEEDLILRIASLEEIQPEVAADLKILAGKCLDYFVGNAGAQVSGARLAADIINRFDGDKAQIMQMMKQHNGKLAKDVESNMFDFVILSEQTEETLNTLIAQISINEWALALKGADRRLVNAIRNAMPQRLSNSLDEEMRLLGSVPVSKVVKARHLVMDQVRSLAEDGDITLLLYREKTLE